MPATTSANAIPYPISSDRVSDFPSLAKQAAERLEVLFAGTTDKTTTHSGWAHQSDTGSVRTVGRIHTLDFTIQRISSGFTTTKDTPFDLCTLPASVAAPAINGISIGTIIFNGNSCALVYSASTHRISAYPLSSFTVEKNEIGRGTCTWIA